MIGGIQPGTHNVQPGKGGPVRERSDAVGAPALMPDKNPAAARQDMAKQAPEPVLTDNAERRIEARRAAEDVRLERFRADQIPLPAAQALSTFAVVAAAGQGFENEAPLAGIDILV
ncbi:UDP pyrophosphate phosphatase [Marinobacter salinisoli]|uniref:UDP pyrophosphate phosphatase n=1 Tax=Marinobacter salinisoli TaxID=2769486 RepID=A0ABX7MYW0_9GAMM|nr:UDP pyrophosphate phosphatase [Marinobacter salinisoli]QSP96509.1 UDP pyrophosphate phosphatase [Marinobacter salinisoli]